MEERRGGARPGGTPKQGGAPEEARPGGTPEQGGAPDSVRQGGAGRAGGVRPEMDCPYKERRTVPVARVIEKVNECMSRRDYAGVERVLRYWLQEAESVGDLRGRMSIRSEMVGHYRKTGEKEKAFESARDLEKLIGELEYEGTVSAAVAWINIGTMLSSFGEHEQALTFFERACEVCAKAEAAKAGVETTEPVTGGTQKPGTGDMQGPGPESTGTTELHGTFPPDLAGGLHNNMGLVLSALGRYEEALVMFGKAMDYMAAVPGGRLEQAVTCLNMADTLEAQLGMEEAEKRICDLVEQAEEFLMNPDHPQDGYYAYVCEKCAPVFGHYGYFAAEEEFAARARRIYESAGAR